MPFPTFIPTAAAIIRILETAALALVSTDPIGAIRLVLLASELRQPPAAGPPGGAR